jgi:hypothetical protein
MIDHPAIDRVLARKGQTRRTGEAEDWTEFNGWANSSPLFLELTAVVAQLIKNDAHHLLNGRADLTARLIIAQLVHVYGLRPSETDVPDRG